MNDVAFVVRDVEDAPVSDVAQIVAIELAEDAEGTGRATQ